MISAAENSGYVKYVPLIFVLIWSTGFIVARYGMPVAPPMGFLLYRYVFSALCFFIWIRLAKLVWPVWQENKTLYWHLSVLGLLMQWGYLGGVWVAIKLGMGAGLTALIVGLQPVLTAVYLACYGQRLRWWQYLGLVLGLLGVYLVVYEKIQFQNMVLNPWALLCTVLALLSITAGTLYQKKYIRQVDVRLASTVQFVAAALCALPFALYENQHLGLQIEYGTQFWLALAWSVLGLSLGASSLLYKMIERGAASAVTAYLYLVPVCTALFAWLFFAEKMSAFSLWGVAVTALGVALVLRQSELGQSRK